MKRKIREKKIYIVNCRDEADPGKVVSYSLRDWCNQNKLPYGTVLARVWRTKKQETAGVVYFEETDPILWREWRRGRPKLGTLPPHRENELRTPYNESDVPEGTGNLETQRRKLAPDRPGTRKTRRFRIRRKGGRKASSQAAAKRS